ncbi:MAG: DUF885 family protein, partial [Thermoplasmata archaeon]
MAERAPARGTSDPLGPLEDTVIDHLFELQPSYAIFLGLHQYDGRLPDLRSATTEMWGAAGDRHLAALRAIPEAGLDPSRRLDRRLLELLLESSLFNLRESREYDRNPMTYVGSLSLTAYMVRPYAPLAQRVDAMIRTLREVPRLLREGRSRLERSLPQPFLHLAQSIGEGLPGHFREAEELAGSGSPSLAERIRE